MHVRDETDPIEQTGGPNSVIESEGAGPIWTQDPDPRTRDLGIRGYGRPRKTCVFCLRADFACVKLYASLPH